MLVKTVEGKIYNLDLNSIKCIYSEKYFMKKEKDEDDMFSNVKVSENKIKDWYPKDDIIIFESNKTLDRINNAPYYTRLQLKVDLSDDNIITLFDFNAYNKYIFKCYSGDVYKKHMSFDDRGRQLSDYTNEDFETQPSLRSALTNDNVNGRIYFDLEKIVMTDFLNHLINQDIYFEFNYTDDFLNQINNMYFNENDKYKEYINNIKVDNIQNTMNKITNLSNNSNNLIDSKINELKSYVEENFSKKRKTTKQLNPIDINPSNPLANPKTLNTDFGISKIKEQSIDDMFK